MSSTNVILVDQNDNEIGVMEKLQAHKEGRLHRAFSLFLFQDKKWLLQQRASTKYHSPLLWSNSCCSHPGPSEQISNSVSNRARFEIGIQDFQSFHAFSFIYKCEFENQLIEHELDHVFIGHTTKIPKPNSNEVKATKLFTTNEIKKNLQIDAGRFTYWFKEIYLRVHQIAVQKGLVE